MPHCKKRGAPLGRYLPAGNDDAREIEADCIRLSNDG